VVQEVGKTPGIGLKQDSRQGGVNAGLTASHGRGKRSAQEKEILLPEVGLKLIV
jgi:hypothetical protein